MVTWTRAEEEEESAAHQPPAVAEAEAEGTNEQLGINFSRSHSLSPPFFSTSLSPLSQWKLIVTEESRTFLMKLLSVLLLLAPCPFECYCSCLANKLAIGPFELNQVTKC